MRSRRNPSPVPDGASLRATVQAYYTERLGDGGCCSGAAVAPDAAEVPSFGCGDPNAGAALRRGETVLDLGSGAGYDAFRAAEAVGPSGTVIGVDMTAAMLARARRAALERGLSNVRFVEGTLEDLPLADASVDVVISNCVVNLCADVPRVLGEAHRVLRPGGRVRISDTFRVPTAGVPDDAQAWCACVAGAHDAATFAAQARSVGFVDVAVEPDAPADAAAHAGAVYGAVLRATKAEIVDETEPADGAALLARVGLPLEGWAGATTRRWGVRERGRLQAVIALEVLGGHGLLRSLATAPEERGRGLAWALVAHALRAAREAGLVSVAGLTTTVPELLPRWGFREVPRAALSAALDASAELRGACPASARAFLLDLAP